MKKFEIPRLAFTLVEIMIVVAVIGLLAVLAVPNLLKARSRSQANTCINNLRQIESAKHQWALEMNKTGDALPEKSDIAVYLGRAGNIETIHCPADPTSRFDNSYSINQVSNPPTCKLNDSGVVSHHQLL